MNSQLIRNKINSILELTNCLKRSLCKSNGHRFIWFKHCALKESNGVLVSGEGESGNELGEENVDLQLS